MPLVIFDPRAEPGVPIEPYSLRLDPTARSLTIGLLSNGFPDATNLLLEVGRALGSHLGDPEIKVYKRADASILVSEEMLTRATEACDAIVTAIGHCGSCTSSAVRDAVLVARRKVPVVALVTEKFWVSGEFVARSVGMPDVPRVKLPHPVSGTGRANLARVADGIAAAVRRALVDGVA